MPDFKSKIVAMQERRAEIRKEEEDEKIKNGDEGTIQDKFDSTFSDKKKPQKEPEQPLNFNPNSLGDIVAGTSSEDVAERRRIANQSYGGDESLVESSLWKQVVGEQLLTIKISYLNQEITLWLVLEILFSNQLEIWLMLLAQC